MPDLTLAQAMEWLEERPRMHTEPQLVAAGRVLAAEIRRRDGETCVWAEDEDGNWDTGCGEMFVFEAGGPAENGMVFCPYCGKHGAWQKREGE